MGIRRPAVAGYFYAGTREGLIRQIEECFTSEFGPGKLPKVNESGPREILALVCPHAGYMYSGSVAAHSYYRLAMDGRPESFVILGPNHTGMGSAISMMDRGRWRTPLGDAEIDHELASLIFENSDIIDIESDAHLEEHSIEVQLPFLQYIYGKISFVPICMALQDLGTAREVAKAISAALRKKRNVVVVASTDFTHYEPYEQAKRKDKEVIDAILALDEERMYEIIGEKNVTMCGPGPVAVAILVSKALGARKADLLKYLTSGDVTLDKSAVVGYGAIAITR